MVDCIALMVYHRLGEMGLRKSRCIGYGIFCTMLGNVEIV